jgi:pimeloyl-ACP methyl ester carboxylesterase
VVIFTPGFLLNSSLYRSYALRLASWGYTVLLWDLSDVLDDTLTCAFMKQVRVLSLWGLSCGF